MAVTASTAVGVLFWRDTQGGDPKRGVSCGNKTITTTNNDEQNGKTREESQETVGGGHRP